MQEITEANKENEGTSKKINLGGLACSIHFVPYLCSLRLLLFNLQFL